jgi:hypothetical protein
MSGATVTANSTTAVRRGADPAAMAEDPAPACVKADLPAATAEVPVPADRPASVAAALAGMSGAEIIEAVLNGASQWRPCQTSA